MDLYAIKFQRDPNFIYTRLRDLSWITTTMMDRWKNFGGPTARKPYNKYAIN